MKPKKQFTYHYPKKKEEKCVGFGSDGNGEDANHR